METRKLKLTLFEDDHKRYTIDNGIPYEVEFREDFKARVHNNELFSSLAGNTVSRYNRLNLSFTSSSNNRWNDIQCYLTVNGKRVYFYVKDRNTLDFLLEAIDKKRK